MNKRLFLFAALTLAFATSVFAQNNDSNDNRPKAYLVGSTRKDAPVAQYETPVNRPQPYLFYTTRNEAATRPRVYKSADSDKNPAKAADSFELERQAFELINKQREISGLPSLVWSDDVARIARMHSENMAKFDFFSHKGIDGMMVNERADLLGIRKWRAIGENIAYNQGYKNPVEFAVKLWMESPGHRENLLNSRWKESGIGVAVTNDGTYYFTEVFLLRK